MSARKDTFIQSIMSAGFGHWRVIVVHYNYGRGENRFRTTSTTEWEHITTDSMAIDDFRSDDPARQKRGEKALIRQAKRYGFKKKD